LPTPEETSRRLQAYRQVLLIEFADVQEGRRPKVHEIMFELERDAFLSRLCKAFAYAAGPCRICGGCVAQDIDSPNEYSKKQCRYPEKARPAMEAAGIDVFQTARKAGYAIRVIRDTEDRFTLFCLLLVE
jgi:predicted metal-binding protein